MNNILTLLLALAVWNVQDASADIHSLKYFMTATSGVKNFPELVGTAEVDGVQVGYCDSNIRSAEPKQEWTQQLVRDYPNHQKWYNFRCSDNQLVNRKFLKDLSQRLNQSGGSHVLQRMSGCEIDDESDEVVGYNQFGYDGEDFIVLDLETLMWTAPSPQAFTTKLIWDTQKERLEYHRHNFKVKCPEWLKIYVDYGKSVLQRKELPSMALLQKTPTSMVCCHATGFYPRLAMMFWKRGGEELHEHIEHGELLPNHDGTFQMSVNLNVSAVPLAEWPEYECVFQFGGVKEQLVIKLDQDAIQSNWIPPQKVPAGVVIGGVVGLLLSLLAAAAVGCYIRKRNADGEFQAVDERSDHFSDERLDQSPPPAPAATPDPVRRRSLLQRHRLRGRCRTSLQRRRTRGIHRSSSRRHRLHGRHRTSLQRRRTRGRHQTHGRRRVSPQRPRTHGRRWTSSQLRQTRDHP